MDNSNKPTTSKIEPRFPFGMNSFRQKERGQLGQSLQFSWEYLRVGRKLQLLPTLSALFKAGKLSWSKVRLISRVADQESEPLLCHAALDASVSDVKRICDTYRWGEDSNSENSSKDENDRAIQHTPPIQLYT